MMFKNSFKLLMTNFSTVWKLLFYKLIILAFVFGLFCITLPTFNSLTNVQELEESISSFLTSYNFNSSFSNLLISLFAIIQIIVNMLGEMLTFAPWTLIYLILLTFILLPTLWRFSDIAVGETLYGFMASQTKYGFVASLIKNLKVSVSYSLLYSIITLPYNLLILAGAYGLLCLVNIGGLLLYALPFILFVFLLLTISIKITILSGFMPAIVTFNCNEFTGLRKGVKAVSRRFYRTWSTSIIICAITMALLSFFGVFSAILIVPIFSFWILIFEMVMFFGSQGMRFYVDSETIVTPKKLEETDSVRKLKLVI